MDLARGQCRCARSRADKVGEERGTTLGASRDRRFGAPTAGGLLPFRGRQRPSRVDDEPEAARRERAVRVLRGIPGLDDRAQEVLLLALAPQEPPHERRLDEDIRRLVGLEASTDGARGSEADALRAEVERLRREIDELKSPATLSPPGGVSTLVGMGFDRAQAEHALSVARSPCASTVSEPLCLSLRTRWTPPSRPPLA